MFDVFAVELSRKSDTLNPIKRLVNLTMLKRD